MAEQGLAAVVLAALVAEGVRRSDWAAAERRFSRRLADALWLGAWLGGALLLGNLLRSPASDFSALAAANTLAFAALSGAALSRLSATGRCVDRLRAPSQLHAMATSCAEPVLPARDPARVFLPDLESLRGIAIGLVLIGHVIGAVNLGEVRGWVSVPAAIFIAGHTGVTLFFVLSGYLVSRPFLTEGRAVSVGHYFTRRAVRILPLYVPTVLLTAAFVAQRWTDLWRAVPHLLFLPPGSPLAPPLLTNTQPPLGLSGQWWSLSTEVQFYLVLPVIAWLLSSRRSHLASAALAIGWLAAYVALLRGDFRLGSTAHFGALLSLLTRAPAFAAGAALAWVELRYGEALRHALASRSWLRAGGSDLALVAVVLGLGLLLRAVVHDGYTYWEERCNPWHVAEATLWCSMMALLRFAPLRLRPLLVNAPLGTLGRISYSLYLIHLPVIWALLSRDISAHILGRGLTGQLTLAVMLVIASLGVAVVTYRVVEHPVLHWKRRVTV
ncbi:MAG TPA: acyltransferase [Myxococcota bacterium]|nr:acyltransferase [Myxococcota bacterium]